MQGIFIEGDRPKSKTAVKTAVRDFPWTVNLEATSIFGDEASGSVNGLPDGDYLFVGPDPYTSRKFYGKITVRGETIKVS